MTERVAVAIFAKAPNEGFAKTRLIPRLGAKGAAELQRHMIRHAVEDALTADIGPVSLWCTPHCEHELFLSLAATHSIELRSQCGADLGLRMMNAFELMTSMYSLIIIGTDCPVLTSSHLIDCARLLQLGHDAVFLPTEDGGYALVGAAKPWSPLFQDMPWGTVRVMQETRLRAESMRLRIAEPARVWDIDTPEDYDRAVKMGLLEQLTKQRS